MESCKDMAQHRKRLNADSYKIEKGKEPRSSSVKMKIGAKKQTAKVKNGGISRKINDLLQCWGGVLKKEFVKFVVQDLTSGGHEWMRAKWSAPIRRYWKISEQMMVKYEIQGSYIVVMSFLLRFSIMKSVIFY